MYGIYIRTFTRSSSQMYRDPGTVFSPLPKKTVGNEGGERILQGSPTKKMIPCHPGGHWNLQETPTPVGFLLVKWAIRSFRWT